MLLKQEKAKIVKEFGKNEHDTGSDAVQIAILTERIKQLTAHLKVSKKDASARRCLMILVGQRRSLLRHLAEKDRDAYVELLVKLGIRK